MTERPPDTEKVQRLSLITSYSDDDGGGGNSAGKTAEGWRWNSANGSDAGLRRPSVATAKTLGLASIESELSSYGSRRRGHLESISSTVPAAAKPNMHQKSRRPRESRCVHCSRAIVENRFFIAIATLLTLYALVGDDFRLLATEMPADVIFNGITLTCLLFFGMELVLASIGKPDYFMGFFFILDIVSTASLVLDLTWVSDALLGNGEDLDKLRSGKSARAGARLGRVVRVIRLVRILKLYKAIHEARARQRAREKERASMMTDDDEWLEDEEQVKLADQHMKESQVGKKLGEVTIRKVIILVLTMLLVLPFLRVETGEQGPLGAYFAADQVWLAYQALLQNPSSEELLLRYEHAMLRTFYYFNWFTGHDDCPKTESPYECSNSFLSHVFWGGIVSDHWNAASILDAQAMGLQLRASTVLAWNEAVSQQDYIYRFGTMPSQALSIMSGSWSTECNWEDLSRQGFSILRDEIKNKVAYKVPCPEDLRLVERFKYFPRLMTEGEYGDWHFAFYFDLRPFTSQEAMYGILTTLFVCVVLCVASLYFSNDANRLVLRPVEAMVKRVELIRDDPLVAVKMADEEFKAEEQQKARQRKMSNSRRFMSKVRDVVACGAAAPAEVMETVILERTIIKLGSLLVLGFGEAGANIIGHNMHSKDTALVDAMIAGSRVECIMGVARIQDFSTATEVLQAKVMTFVNQIAEIVHGVVDEFSGAANKNNGENFLLVWRISELDESTRMRYAEMSLVAFAKILGAVHRSSLLAQYRSHPGLQQRLGRHCRVNLSFGLHAGWTIEGAVGSEYKIDASYLSPNVSIAGSVELATLVYGVPIVVSQSVVDMCSSEMASKCRLIDCVIIRGSTDPMMLYSLDLDYSALPIDDSSATFTWNSRQRYKARQLLDAEKARKIHPEVKLVSVFDGNKDIALMRWRYSTEFLQLFNMGYQNYSEGEWKVARRLLQRTRLMLKVVDGPSEALLKHMGATKFNAPDGWQGVRELNVF
mmetsp:Transcript_18173/g.42486  ORF Transcript_18173/g.42486 Transcript_18173/m.42486 type:complete len:993 (+) Transcript_18173:314-3292(+)